MAIAGSNGDFAIERQVYTGKALTVSYKVDRWLAPFAWSGCTSILGTRLSRLLPEICAHSDLDRQTLSAATSTRLYLGKVMQSVTGDQVMEYRKLGSTGLLVSLLGFGTSPLGDVFYKVDPHESVRAVHTAIENGINFFDTSPYYGLTLAESRLGQALNGKRQQVILATKCGRYGVDHFDFSAARIAKSIDESLKRLNTDYVDVLQAHDVEFGNVNQIINETIPEMRRMQASGKARFIGISGYPLKTLLRIADTIPVDTILSYCRYNLMNTDMDQRLTPFARDNGIGLINASGLQMGLLTERGAPEWHPAPPEVRNAAKRIVQICQRHGVNVSEVALRFCFDHPYVSTTLVGMASQAEVKTNLDLLRVRTDEKLVREIRDAIGPSLECVWPSGAAENQE
jgi:L-galactose dehydrogenase